MTTVTIELDHELEEVLEGLAASERKTTQQVCREALEAHLLRRVAPSSGQGADRNSALSRMIGMVKKGPADASTHHDRRAGEA
jgi:hypothetical protein